MKKEVDYLENTGTLKAVTIPQPWAYLIVTGQKNFYFENWNPFDHGLMPGEWLYIHAGSEFKQVSYDAAINASMELPPVEFFLKYTGVICGVVKLNAVNEHPHKNLTISLNKKDTTPLLVTYQWDFGKAQPVPLIQAKGKKKIWALDRNQEPLSRAICKNCECFDFSFPPGPWGTRCSNPRGSDFVSNCDMLVDSKIPMQCFIPLQWPVA